MPLIQKAIDAASSSCAVVSLVGDPDKYRSFALPVVPDAFPGHGPLAGIEAALRETRSDWNLVLACDMPSIAASVVNDLFLSAESSPDADAVLPAYPDGRLEPLCAVYHRRCHRHIAAAIDGGVLKVTSALEGLALRYVPVTRSEVFTNLNTPEDLRRYRDV